MAIYHFSAKAVKRSAGRSSVAAAAYRAGEKLFDSRTSTLHDYSRKQGVLHTSLHSPAGDLKISREAVWNLAEEAERRKDSCVAREYVVALPAEISLERRIALASAFASFLAKTQRCLVDCAVHAPSREGDSRNFHAHLLCTTREFDGASLGAKLVTERAGQNRKRNLNFLRLAWERVVNKALELASETSRVDHRSYADQKRNVFPTKHLGAAATAIERRIKTPSQRRISWRESFEIAPGHAASRGQALEQSKPFMQSTHQHQKGSSYER